MEYQAKALFDMQGIPTMRGCVITEAADAEKAVDDAQLTYPVVVKAQVQIGGRGKAGGILFAESAKQACEHCRRLLGKELRGHVVRRLLLVEKCEHEAEWYLSILLDRLTKQPMILFSPLGGVDIEQTAKEDPDKVKRITIDPLIGVQDYMARYLLSSSSLPMEYFKSLNELLKKLYQCFMENDCMLVEINPLAVCESGQLIALDGKVDVDDSALFRLPHVSAWRDEMPEPELVREARSYNFLYIPVDAQGTIAVCSNGSGMLMSCIDMISKEGMRTVAALDLGGGATKERIAEAMRILFSTKGVKAVLINIFGGITRCDEVAGGIKLAAENHVLDGKLVVVRMEGTNKSAGIDIINGIDADVIRTEGLRESIAALSMRRASL